MAILEGSRWCESRSLGQNIPAPDIFLDSFASGVRDLLNLDHGRGLLSVERSLSSG